MWRIGQLARLAGVSERTLRLYDQIGLLPPAAVDAATAYRWYGVAELSRLERIRALQDLGLTLRQIADVIDAPDPQVRQAVSEAVTRLRGEIADLAAVAGRAAAHLAGATPLLPQLATVGARHLRVRYLHVDHPAELARECAGSPALLLTWLRGQPVGGFTAALAASRGGERLTLPPRRVVRVVVPGALGTVRAGQELFGWIHRNRLGVTGPTLEEHLADASGAQATILEIPVAPAG